MISLPLTELCTLRTLAKPDPQMYTRAVELLDMAPSDCVMVAAHAYDLRAAAKIGMKTVYIQRETEDLHENMDELRTEFDAFVDGTAHRVGGGISEIAALLNKGI
ncbi:HAD-like domain-containing protein [Favolaschia claudopus]|uniref:HAD-like domain-containing protein n=1 Tax=Favolaschia claudopus TaxID=2862362 RepID=A0AAW0CUA1_9AGAR